eukprot:Hpha_TRINITY_DN8075_c0_g2::TRINITY_DN8075_c0_g2_i1::g.140181::m.140181
MSQRKKELYERLGVQTLSPLEDEAVSHVTDGAIRRGDRTFQGKALFCLATTNPLRYLCIGAVTHPWFDNFVLFLILVNTVFLVIDDPLADPNSTTVEISEKTDVVFLALFSAECAVKIIAMGFVRDKYAYLRDMWNVVDFFIVVSGHVNLWVPAGSGNNIGSLLRLIRVFRPLRSINRVPGMRKLVNTLFSCLPIMVDVVLLAVLIFYLFSLCGVVLWNDSLHHRCWLPDSVVGGTTRGPDPSDLQSWFHSDTGGRWGRVCGNTSAISYFRVECPERTTCTGGAPAPYKFANFDHIGKAIMLVFQCVSLDGWISHAYAIEDGWSPLAAVFFVFLTLFGAYFFANLILAVVTDALTKHVGEEAVKAAKPMLTTNALVQHVESQGPEGVASPLSQPASPQGAASPMGAGGPDFFSPTRSTRKERLVRLGHWDLEREEDVGSTMKSDPGVDGSIQTGERKEHEGGRHTRITRGTHVVAQMEYKKFINGLSKQAMKGVENYGKKRRQSEDRTGAVNTRKRAQTVTAQAPREEATKLPPELRAFAEVHARRCSAPSVAGVHMHRSHSVITLSQYRRLSLTLKKGKESSDDPEASLLHRAGTGLRRGSPATKFNMSELLSGSLDEDVQKWRQIRSDLDVRFRVFAARRAGTAAALNVVAVVSSLAHIARRRLLPPSPTPPFRQNSKLTPLAPLAPLAIPGEGVGLSQPLLRNRARRASQVSVISEGARSMAETVASLADTVRSNVIRRKQAAEAKWREERRKHGGLQGMLAWAMTSAIFMNFIALCILFNSLMMSIEHYDMSQELNEIMKTANLVVTIIFVAETVLKIIAFGPIRWAKDGFNIFDAVVAGISLGEILISGQSSGLSLLRVLRLSRVLRVLKLARRWQVLQRVISVIAGALSYIGYLCLLIVLFIFIFAVLGRALFAGKLQRPLWCHQRHDEELCGNTSVIHAGGDQCGWVPDLPNKTCSGPEAMCCRVQRKWNGLDNTNRANFDTLPFAALHVFQILTKDNWALLCFRVMREIRGAYVSFFLVILVLGTYLLFSMFIAILLVKLGDDNEQKKQLQNKLGIEDEKPDRGASASDGSPAPSATPGTASPIPGDPTICVAPLITATSSVDETATPNERMIMTDRNSFNPQSFADTPLQTTAPGNITSFSRQSFSGPPRFTSISTDQKSPTQAGSFAGSPSENRSIASPSGFPGSMSSKLPTRTEAKLMMLEMRKERKEELKETKRMNYRARERRESFVVDKRRISRGSAVPGASSPRDTPQCSPSHKTEHGERAARSWKTLNFDEETASCGSHTLRTGGLVSALKGTRKNLVPKESPDGEGSERGSLNATQKPQKKLKMGEVAVVDSPEPESPAGREGRAAVLDNLFREAKVLDGDEKLLNFAEDDERSDDADWEPLEGKSCCMFGTDNKLRIALTDLLLGRWFEYIISYMILFNCVLITLNENLLGSHEAFNIVRYIDWGFTGVFTIEICVRCIVHGAFIEDRNKSKEARKVTYLRRHKWNIVDALIVLFSLSAIPLEFVFDRDHRSFNTVTRMIKAARAFRPLRILVRTKRMKVVIGAFVSTIPAVFNVLAVAFVLYFVFGIAGTQLLAGRYRRCSDGSDKSKVECLNTTWNATKRDQIWLPENVTWRIVENTWHNPMAYGFDHLIMSWITLLEVASLSGWMDIMYEAMDGPDEVDGRPLRMNNTPAAAFFVVWIFCGAYCVMNIFTGVVVDHFTREKLELSGYGSVFLTEHQEHHLRVKRILANSKAKKRRVLPKEPSLLNHMCYFLVCNKYFPKFILLCVMANMGLMAGIHHNMDEDYEKVQSNGNFAFTIIFTIEMFLEIGISGVRSYLRFRWCRLDCAIVLVSWLEFAISIAFGSGGSNASVIQILRLGRAVRVLKHFKGLRDLLMTLFYSLPAFYNISSLLLLMCFMYGVLGTALFEDVRTIDAEEVYPVMLSNVASFNNFPRSFYTLYRVATMDSWVRVIQGCRVQEPYCSESANNCGDSIAAFFFFTTFQLSVGFVMMNLFIAVVLENFRESVLLPEELMTKMDQ